MTTPVQSHLELGAQLGGGYFGTVHLGVHPVHGSVAVKIFERRPGEDDASWNSRRDELLAEGQHLKSAEHERVVRVFDVTYDTSADRVFLVLELCPNGSLEAQYKQGATSLRQVRAAGTDAALGLESVHARNLLHRDIKPANLLVDADGRIKLGDFGLVTDRLVLGYGSAAGYSDHIAFEVWSTSLTSVKSDIWALGMTIYRLLHGKAFYDQLPPARLVVQQGGFAHSLPWLAHIPREWQRFVRKCLNDDPSRRYQSAQQVLEALGRLPTSPEWFCDFTPRKTTWRRSEGQRVIEVTHLVHSTRRHEWVAVSRQIASGRTRKLDGSPGIVNRMVALAGLHGFLVS